MTPANPDHPSWGGKRKPRQGKAIGRPRLHPSGLSRFYINLSPDDLAWLDEHAGEMGTRASVVRRLIDEARAGRWQPIETAPKDGTRLFLWSPDLGYHAGHWENAQWKTLTGFNAGGPTHWMPLPERPAPAAPEPEGE
jgi:hypothetical protein